MKRDMDLVRRILLELEDSSEPLDASAFATDAAPRAMVGYHFRIMDEAGLIVATIRVADNDPYYFAKAVRLTWDGHDFLAAVRSERIWSRVKMSVAKTCGDAALCVFKDLAVRIATESLT